MRLFSLCKLSLLLSSLSAFLLAQPPELLIAAASDLSNLQAPLEQAFGAHAKLTFTFGSSGMLSRQIENGAPFDVFLSANEGFMANLVAKGKVDQDAVKVYALGRLGMWSKSEAAFRTFADLLKFSRLKIAIANPQHAPYGMAAEQTLRKAKLWDRLKDKIVLAENVRQAFQFAETGNADVCLTAWSLVYDKNAVLVPYDAHEPIRQVGAEIKKKGKEGRKTEQLAREFLEFLTSPAGRELLATRGFFLPPPPPSLKGRER